MRAPKGLTHPFPINDGSMAGSLVDLMFITGWKGNPPPVSGILNAPAALASDHLPIVVTVRTRQEMNGLAKEIFLPTPHRMKDEAMETAAALYRADFPRVAAKIRACGSHVAFHGHIEDLQAVILKPWILKMEPKSERHTSARSATDDSIVKWRSKVVRRALRNDGK